jgi:hypothetical protein
MLAGNRLIVQVEIATGEPSDRIVAFGQHEDGSF